MKRSIEYLKSRFLTKYKPTVEDFADWLDSFQHKDSETLFDKANEAEARAGVNNSKFMTPFLAKVGIEELCRLAQLPSLGTDVQAKIDTSISTLLSLEDSDNVINSVKDVLDAFAGSSEDLSILSEITNRYTKAEVDARLEAAKNELKGGADSGIDTLQKVYDKLNGEKVSKDSLFTEENNLHLHRDVLVGGDPNTYYPVVIDDTIGGQTLSTIQITKEYHNYQQNDGKVFFMARFNNYRWGAHEQVHQILAHSWYRKVFIGGVQTSRNGFTGYAVWLRGGGRTYRFRSRNMPQKHTTVKVYLSGVTIKGVTFAPKSLAQGSKVISEFEKGPLVKKYSDKSPSDPDGTLYYE